MKGLLLEYPALVTMLEFYEFRRDMLFSGDPLDPCTHKLNTRTLKINDGTVLVI